MGLGTEHVQTIRSSMRRLTRPVFFPRDKVTEPLAEETALAVEEQYPASDQSKQPPKPHIDRP